MSETQGNTDIPGLSTTDMDITSVLNDLGAAPVPPEPEDNASPSTDMEDVPVLMRGSGSKSKKLVKNEDKEVRDRYVGATYEVHQFNLWKAEDLKAYQELMTSVGTDKYSRVVFQERMYLQDKQSWTILVEIQHFALISR